MWRRDGDGGWVRGGGGGERGGGGRVINQTLAVSV